MLKIKRYGQFQNEGLLSGALPALEKAVVNTDKLLNKENTSLDTQTVSDTLDKEQKPFIEDIVSKQSWERIMASLNGLDPSVLGAVKATPEYQQWEQRVKNVNIPSLQEEANDPGVEGAAFALDSTVDVVALEQRIINRAQSIQKAIETRKNQQLNAKNQSEVIASFNNLYKRAQNHNVEGFIAQYLDPLMGYNAQPGTPQYENARKSIEEIRNRVSPGFEEEANSILEHIVQLEPEDTNKAIELLVKIYDVMLAPGFQGTAIPEQQYNKMGQDKMSDNKNANKNNDHNLNDQILNNQKLTKTASDHFGISTLLYGPTEKRICPKLRGKGVGDVVSEYTCRHHCLDGIVIDDNKTICGEALWRANVMDKFSREYVNEDGDIVGGYINKRFEINRNVPEENKMRLKPGETRKPRPLSQGNMESRLQDMRNKEADKREYRPDADTSKPFDWAKDVDQNNVEVSQEERERREKESGHKTVQYTKKTNQENKPEITEKTAQIKNNGFNLSQYKQAQFENDDDKFDYVLNTGDYLPGFVKFPISEQIYKALNKNLLHWYADLQKSCPRWKIYKISPKEIIFLNEFPKQKKEPDELEIKSVWEQNLEKWINQSTNSLDNDSTSVTQASNKTSIKTGFNLKQHKQAQFEDDFEDLTVCPACGGPGMLLGPMGNLNHYRCRNCGMDFNTPIDQTNAKPLPSNDDSGIENDDSIDSQELLDLFTDDTDFNFYDLLDKIEHAQSSEDLEFAREMAETAITDQDQWKTFNEKFDKKLSELLSLEGPESALDPFETDRSDPSIGPIASKTQNHKTGFNLKQHIQAQMTGPRGPIGPDNPQSDDLGLSEDYDFSDDYEFNSRKNQPTTVEVPINREIYFGIFAADDNANFADNPLLEKFNQLVSQNLPNWTAVGSDSEKIILEYQGTENLNDRDDRDLENNEENVEWEVIQIIAQLLGNDVVDRMLIEGIEDHYQNDQFFSENNNFANSNATQKIAQNRKIRVGDHVKISGGSGLDSDKTGIIIPWGHPEAQKIRNEFPFVGGRTPESMKWVCIKLDSQFVTGNNTVTTVPINRVSSYNPADEASLEDTVSNNGFNLQSFKTTKTNIVKNSKTNTFFKKKTINEHDAKILKSDRITVFANGCKLNLHPEFAKLFPDPEDLENFLDSLSPHECSIIDNNPDVRVLIKLKQDIERDVTNSAKALEIES